MNVTEINGQTYVNNIDLPRYGVCTVRCVEHEWFKTANSTHAIPW